MARATEPRSAAPSTDGATGPPLLVLLAGYASFAGSLVLLGTDGIPAHLVGYTAGALVPILVLGVVRRVDLERRRNPRYVASAIFPPLLVLLAVLALLAGALHIWPIATELAS